MARLLRLTPREGAGDRFMEARFGRCNAIFLARSGPGAGGSGHSLTLTEDPRPGSLVYAVFTRCGAEVFARSMRAEATLSLSSPPFVNDGDGVEIGARGFVVWLPAERASRRRGIALFCAAIAAVALAAAALRHRGGRSAEARVERGAVEAAHIAGPDAGDPMEEARHMLRRGDTGQAKLALVEIREGGRGGTEVEALLAAIEAAEVNSQDSAAALEARDAEERAESLYREGMEAMRSGDPRGAADAFDAAALALGHSAPETAFAKDLQRAQSEARSALDSVRVASLERAAKIVESAEGMEAPEAAAMIAGSWTDISDFMKGDRGGGRAAALRRKIRDGIGSVAARWLASAREAERLFGCERASKTYAQIREFMSRVGALGINSSLMDSARCTEREVR
ncbi:MAG: hypothetical protein JXA24_07275 [Proteobacteria bacterium]|nr:hypothetical protein [Pseudomonadota bacterium]